jgi:hypothetical protein
MYKMAHQLLEEEGVLRRRARERGNARKKTVISYWITMN